MAADHQSAEGVAEDGRARFTIHTAFDDPTSPPDAPPRESIETRTFVFF